MKPQKLSPLLQAFFTTRLAQEKEVSDHTLASYSKTFELLLLYIKKRLNKNPEKIALKDISAQFVSQFLIHLEKERGISSRTRNCRLAAIRSFFRYLSPKIPEMSEHIAEVLAIPNKRADHKQIDFLNEKEVNALLNAPNQKKWLGKRDHAILLLAIETGFRLSELTKLTWENIHFGTTTLIKCLGKGRKHRSTPATSQLINCLKEWSKENRCLPSDVVFPTIHGDEMSSDSVQYLVKKYAKMAEEKCPSMKKKRVSPHILRHTSAMRLLTSGAEQTAIALWLGHESIKTTYIYLSADISMKEEILNKLPSTKTKLSRYKPPNRLMEFLRNQQNRRCDRQADIRCWLWKRRSAESD